MLHYSKLRSFKAYDDFKRETCDFYLVNFSKFHWCSYLHKILKNNHNALFRDSLRYKAQYIIVKSRKLTGKKINEIWSNRPRVDPA